MALSWSMFTTITREHFMKKLEDNIYDKSKFLKVMLNDQAVKINGGRKIVEPLKYGKSTAVGTYNKYDTFDLTPWDSVTAAEYNWGHYFSSIVMAGTDVRQNRGKEQVLNLIRIKMEEAEMALRDKLADDIYTGSDSEGIIGLASAVSDTSTAYGGITSTDFSGWVSGEDSTSHTSANMEDSTSSSYVVTLLQNAIRECTHLGERPNLIVTNLFIWDLIERVINADTHFNKQFSPRSKAVADLGVDVINFRGIPIIADEKCPDATMYALNTNFLKFVIHPEANFTFTGYQKPTNQDSRVGQILLDSQLVLTNRRMHYKFDALPTS